MQSKSLIPQPKQVTPHAEEILAIIRDKGDWTLRSEIAEALGKKGLTAWERGLISVMVDAGRLQMARRQRGGGIGFEYVYKAKAK